jgi:anaerobic C4-dicarboxylate transporter
MSEIDLDELAKDPRYEATIARTVVLQTETDRHLQIARFYLTALALFMMGVIALGLLIWYPDASVKEWAKTILSTFASAAIGFQAGKGSIKED